MESNQQMVAALTRTAIGLGRTMWAIGGDWSMEPGEVELKGLPGDYYTVEPGVPTCASGRQLDWFMGSPSFVNGVDTWVGPDGAKAHRTVFCRFMVELYGDRGGRARRPQALRGLTRDESGKALREEGRNDISGGAGDSLDVVWRRWKEDAEAYLKRKEGASGRKYRGMGFVCKHVRNTVSAPQGRGHGCALDGEAKYGRDTLARICEMERLRFSPSLLASRLA